MALVGTLDNDSLTVSVSEETIFGDTDSFLPTSFSIGISEGGDDSLVIIGDSNKIIGDAEFFRTGIDGAIEWPLV